MDCQNQCQVRKSGCGGHSILLEVRPKTTPRAEALAHARGAMVLVPGVSSIVRLTERDALVGVGAFVGVGEGEPAEEHFLVSGLAPGDVAGGVGVEGIVG